MEVLGARRLAERGVRFIELIDGSSSHNWDQHSNMKSHADHAKAIDKPIAGLLKDLKDRGMLDDTLVVWTTEFGRTPGLMVWTVEAITARALARGWQAPVSAGE